MENLILTGWGWKDYACAAALALRHWKTADILGKSTRRLPEFLYDVGQYKNIVILGIGLTGDPELLEKALKRLKAKSVRVFWISSIDAPKSISEEIRSSLDIFVDGDGITDAVSLCYDLPYDDLQSLREEEKPDRKVLPYHQLLEAAMYSYRNYQDEKSYGDAIRHIANADPENCEFCKIV